MRTILEGTKVRLKIQLLSTSVEIKDMRGLKQVRGHALLLIENLIICVKSYIHI